MADDKRQTPGLLRRLVGLGVRITLLAVVLLTVTVGLFQWINPPYTMIQRHEASRLGEIHKVWVPIENISPTLVLSVMAAEDARFCDHWGFDTAEIRRVVTSGASGGASTLTQQVAKNVFLWPTRSWVRKGMEAALTPLIELTWSKRRIMEVYLNVAEMGKAVFGAEAAAQHHFNRAAADLSLAQSSRIAGILPSPRTRNPAAPTRTESARAFDIADGAATLANTGRADCVLPD